MWRCSSLAKTLSAPCKMTGATTKKSAPTRKPVREDQHETTRISAGGRSGLGDVLDCRTGDRSIDARTEMAAHGELAGIAPDPLWGPGIHGPAYRPDPPKQ